MKFLFSSGFFLFRVNNGELEFLLLQYPHGHWELPKGKIEKGESKQEAAMRELKEETGLDAELIPGYEEQLEYFFKHAGELNKKTVYFFVGRALSQEVTLSDEHIGYTWLPFDQALERLTFDNAKKLLTKAHTFLEHKKTGQ